MLAYWVLGLVPVAAVAYIVWSHRKKAASRSTSRSNRLAQLLDKEAPVVAATPAADSPQAPENPRADPESPQAVAEGYAARQKVFSPHHAVVFYSLKASLPDYEVLAHVSLAALLEAPAEMQNWERERRRRALAPHVFDCVICGKDMQVVAALDIVPPNVHQPVFKAQCLEMVGVRYVRIDPTRMPKRQDIRGLVLG